MENYLKIPNIKFGPGEYTVIYGNHNIFWKCYEIKANIKGATQIKASGGIKTFDFAEKLIKGKNCLKIAYYKNDEGFWEAVLMILGQSCSKLNNLKTKEEAHAHIVDIFDKIFEAETMLLTEGKFSIEFWGRMNAEQYKNGIALLQDLDNKKYTCQIKN